MNKNKQFLEDLRAFVEYVDGDVTSNDSRKVSMLVSTLLHDLNGVIEDEPLFLPRVNGYAKNKLAND